jgi:hypothetical protein
MGRACSIHREVRNTDTILIGKLVRKLPLGIPRRR